MGTTTPLADRRLRRLCHHVVAASADSPPPPVAEGLPVTLALRLPTESGGLDDGAPGSTVWGHLEIPNPTIMASSLVPICVIHGSQPGRTALLLAGNHGNEYEGQVALRRLASTVQPAQLCGRLIIIPTISMEASTGWAREWPDGTNFNRVMPGDPRGIPAEQLAHFLSAVLIPRADIVYDLHTGGHNMRIQPSTMCFALADAESAHHREEVEAQLAMMAPLMMLRRQPPMTREGGGMVWYESKIQGKIPIGTEWGGGGANNRSRAFQTSLCLSRACLGKLNYRGPAVVLRRHVAPE
jgi:predicted deacylase